MEGMEKVRTCLVIGAAPLRHGEDLRRLYHPGDFVVCADGGLELAQKWGIHPDLAVGDFDSFRGEIPGDLPVVPLNPHKDDTDMLAAVNAGLAHGCRRFLLACGLGGRLDHSYANLCVLHHLHSLGYEAALYGDGEEACLIGEGETRELFCGTGTTVSVFPFACGVCNVSYTGMRYPLDHHDLFSDIAVLPMGVSNVAEKMPCSVTVHSGLALVLCTPDPDAVSRAEE